MRIICIALFALSVILARAQEFYASVTYSHLSALTQEAVVDKDECYISLDAVKNWGWHVVLNDYEADIFCDGKHARVQTEMFGTTPSIPLIEALRQLGGKCIWSDDQTKLQIVGEIRCAQVQNNILQIDSTIEINPKIFILQRPLRLVIDLEGAWYNPSSPPQLPKGFRINQFKPTLVRIVYDHPQMSEMKIPKLQPAKSLSIDLNKNLIDCVPPKNPATQDLFKNVKKDPIQKKTSAEHEEKPLDHSPLDFKPLTPIIPVVQSLHYTLEPLSDSEIILNIPLVGFEGAIQATGLYLNSNTIQLTLPNTLPPEGEQKLAPSPWIREIKRQVNGSTLIYTLFMKKQVAFELSSIQNLVSLRLVSTKHNGPLKGKIIVVDPGHGGKDAGAISLDRKVKEKDLNLKIALQLAHMLTAEGASVILTRRDDIFIPLATRCEIANKNKANIFVSVHINSNKLSNSRSGGITFFHKQDPHGSKLAKIVQDEIAKVSGLPSLGAWSDTKIHRTGFHVLRNSRMHAILIECGFINHDFDKERMLEPAFHANIASAVTKGIKVFWNNGKKENK